MVYIFNHVLLKRILLCFLLTTFAINTIYATPIQFNLGKAAFSIRMEKLIERFNKQKNKNDSNKLIETMFEIKEEIESFIGKKINLEKEFLHIENKLKKEKFFNKKQFDQVKSKIKKYEKKLIEKTLCMDCYLLTNQDISYTEYFLLTTEDKRETTEIVLPINVTVGVTLMLAGGFLCFVGMEIPFLMNVGNVMLTTGFGLTSEGFCQKYEENKAREKQKT